MTCRQCSFPVSSWFGFFTVARIILAGGLLSLPVCTRLAAAVAIPASPCTLGWNQSPDNSVAGYALYYGIAGSTTNRQDVGMMTSVTLFNLIAASNYFFYVVAYDAAGVEGPPSNVLYYSPQALSRLKLTSPVRGTVSLQFRAAPGTGCLIQYSPTLNPPHWKVLDSATADSNGNIVVTDPTAGSLPSRFYRAVLYSNPQLLSALKVVSAVAGTVQIRFHAVPGAVCQVQYTPSLNPPQWQTLGSATADINGNVTLTDRPPANTTSRFYRAVIR